MALSDPHSRSGLSTHVIHAVYCEGHNQNLCIPFQRALRKRLVR